MKAKDKDVRIAVLTFDNRVTDLGREMRWHCPCKTASAWWVLSYLGSDITKRFLIEGWQRHFVEGRCRKT